MFKISKHVSKIFFHHGLFCASHPKSVITTVIAIVIFFCYPLHNISFSRDVPFEAVSLTESQYRTLKATRTNLNVRKLISFQDNISKQEKITYVVQVIFRSTITPWTSDINYVDGLRGNLNASFHIHHLIQKTTVNSSSCESNCPGNHHVKEYESICMKMKDLIEASNGDRTIENNHIPNPSRIISLPNPSLPFSECAILLPSIIWKNSHSYFQLDDIELPERLSWTDSQGLLDALFGLPRRHTGISKMRFRNLPVVHAFSVTLVLKDFHTDYIDRLREVLLEAYPDSRFISQSIDPNASATDQGGGVDTEGSERRVFVVHYRDQHYLTDYAPLIVIYVVLLLYIYLSVTKIDMVKSKFGLAVSACATVVASLGMSLSLCVAVGVMSPALRGREFFPYLVVLIGFENIVVLTKSVVATPIDLPVKHRIAQGLAKEGWPITKNLLAEFGCITLGFFTFDPAIQEFCLIAIIGLTTDFFLQMFFFVTVLSIDIRRMELSDLQRCSEEAYIEIDHTDSQGICYTNSFAHQNSPNCHPYVSSLSSSTSSLLESNSVPSPSRNRSARAKSVSPEIHASDACRSHRRTRSDAITAAYMASGGMVTPGRYVPLRLRFWLYWAQLRVFQRIFFVVIAIWLIFILCYSLFLRGTTTLQDQITEEVSSDANTLIQLQNTVPDSKDSPSRARSSQELGGKDKTNGFTAAEESLFKMTSANRHGIWLSWDVDTLWRYMAFSNWPTIASLYNLSLANHRLVLLEPIYVSTRIKAKDVRAMRPLGIPAPDVDEDEEHISYVNDEDFEEARDSSKNKAITERLWAHITSFGHKGALVSLGTPLSGLLNWTNLLWNTAEMVLTSFLGASFFLTLTCVGMLIVHKSFSRSKSYTYKEPVVRVLPLTISLNNELLPNCHFKSSTENTSNDQKDWILACGSYPSISKTAFGMQDSLVAAALCGLNVAETSSGAEVSSHLDSLSREIRLWCVESGHQLTSLDRYSSDSMKKKKLDLSRKQPRYCTVWSMKILPCSDLVVGCSDGTLEIWNLQLHCLHQVLDFQKFRRTAESIPNVHTWTTSTNHLQTDSKKFVGGITIIEATPDNCIFVGSYSGYVGLVECNSPIEVNRQWNILRLWDVHSVAVSTLCFDHFHPDYFPTTSKPCSDFMQQHTQQESFPRKPSAFLIVSGGEDGSIGVIETHKPRFQRFIWDSSPVLCIDLNQFTVAIGQGSGRVHILKATTQEDDCLQVHHQELKLNQVISGIECVEPLSTGQGDVDTFCEAVIWVGLFPLISTLSSNHRQVLTRLVTCSLKGSITIWQFGQGPNVILRRFKANPPTFSLPAPIIRMDNRVIFGDQGYLCLVNPWTAKYERSVQLLPHSNEIQGGGRRVISPTSPTFLRRWAKGLGPLAVTNEIQPRRRYIVSLADGGRTLVIVPKSAFSN